MYFSYKDIPNSRQPHSCTRLPFLVTLGVLQIPHLFSLGERNPMDLNNFEWSTAKRNPSLRGRLFHFAIARYVVEQRGPVIKHLEHTTAQVEENTFCKYAEPPPQHGQKAIPCL